MMDLAKGIFAEIGIRMGDEGGVAGSNNDPRALVDDIKKSTAAVLKQMTPIGIPQGIMHPLVAESPLASDSSCNSKARSVPAAPKITVRAASKSLQRKRDVDDAEDEDKGKALVKEECLDNDVIDLDGAFLSAEDRIILNKACAIAGIAEDDVNLPHNDATENSDLRDALLQPQDAGGIGYSLHETQLFLERVNADRATLSRHRREAAEADAKEIEEVKTAEGAVADAAATMEAAVESDEDCHMIALLQALKRAKEEALMRAKEERERKQAVERAAQAALRRIRVCPAGFQWLRVGNDGWRCSAGGHYVSEQAVAAEMARGGTV